MEAIVLTEFGPATNLRLATVPDPEPGSGQVRIAVGASGIHLVDTRIRAGAQLGPFPLPALPFVPGREVAGVVVDGDSDWLGRRVAVSLGNANGGYARLAVANVADLHAVTDDVEDATAVALVGTGRTAFGILEQAELTAADVVLITAAAGGLGTIFVQEAHRRGATVIGLAGGPEKTRLVRELGADVAIDYRTDWVVDPQPTVLLDGVGGAVARRAARALRPGGRALFFGNLAGDPPTAAELSSHAVQSKMTLGPAGGFTPPNIFRWAEAALASGVRPPLTRYPLEDVSHAHTDLESRRTVGKVVLD